MTWAPGLIFLSCCVAQFWFMQRVASALETRHEDKYQAMHGFFLTNRLLWFALTRGDRRLSDPELTRRTKQLQALTLLGLASWLCLTALLLTGHR